MQRIELAPAFVVAVIALALTTPVMVGIVMWHLLVVAPSQEKEFFNRFDRGSSLTADHHVFLHNQMLICNAVHADCE